MSKQIKFKSFRELADFDYGVKGFEVRIQEAIETYLFAYGIESSWWNYYSGSIFMELLALYEQECENQDHMILINLRNYYDKVIQEVTLKVSETQSTNGTKVHENKEELNNEN